MRSWSAPREEPMIDQREPLSRQDRILCWTWELIGVAVAAGIIGFVSWMISS